MRSCSFIQLLLKFKEVYIFANQHFHVAKQYQKIIGSREPGQYLREASEKQGPCKVFSGDIDFSTSIHFISDIICSKSGGVFDSAIDQQSTR